MSPWLLLLAFLKDTPRETLELAARKQALPVDKLLVLYRRIIEETHIKAARIEVMPR